MAVMVLPEPQDRMGSLAIQVPRESQESMDHKERRESKER